MCTRASPRTRSRAGRSRSRSACSPTTAEINTIQGNRNWLWAREGRLSSELLGEFEPLLPITTPGYSDSGTFDECLELLHLAGRSLPHAISMMLPPAWENNDQLDPDVRAFYEYNNTLIEPWDGPADIIFTDGTQVGALLDRNELPPRPPAAHR